MVEGKKKVTNLKTNKRKRNSRSLSVRKPHRRRKYKLEKRGKKEKGESVGGTYLSKKNTMGIACASTRKEKKEEHTGRILKFQGGERKGA